MAIASDSVMQHRDTPTPDDCYVYQAKVVRIVDGDTVVLNIDLGCDIWLNNEPCRLAKINAPEKRGKTSTAGLAASGHLSDLLSNNSVIIATHRDRRGSFSRLLVDIWCNGIYINGKMVEDGHAEHYEH